MLRSQSLDSVLIQCVCTMAAATPRQKVVVVGAGPVGALAALYAASRGDEVEVYELRGGMFEFYLI